MSASLSTAESLSGATVTGSDVDVGISSDGHLSPRASRPLMRKSRDNGNLVEIAEVHEQPDLIRKQRQLMANNQLIGKHLAGDGKLAEITAVRADSMNCGSYEQCMWSGACLNDFYEMCIFEPGCVDPFAAHCPQHSVHMNDCRGLWRCPSTYCILCTNGDVCPEWKEANCGTALLHGQSSNASKMTAEGSSLDESLQEDVPAITDTVRARRQTSGNSSSDKPMGLLESSLQGKACTKQNR